MVLSYQNANANRAMRSQPHKNDYCKFGGSAKSFCQQIIWYPVREDEKLAFKSNGAFICNRVLMCNSNRDLIYGTICRIRTLDGGLFFSESRFSMKEILLDE